MKKINIELCKYVDFHYMCYVNKICNFEELLSMATLQEAVVLSKELDYMIKSIAPLFELGCISDKVRDDLGDIYIVFLRRSQIIDDEFITLNFKSMDFKHDVDEVVDLEGITDESVLDFIDRVRNAYVIVNLDNDHFIDLDDFDLWRK